MSTGDFGSNIVYTFSHNKTLPKAKLSYKAKPTPKETANFLASFLPYKRTDEDDLL